MLKNVNWKHVFGTALIIAAGIDQYLAGPQGAPLALEMHVSAAGLGLAGTIIILLQNSIEAPAPSGGPSDAAKTATKLTSALLMLLGLVVLMTGCLSSAPIVAETPANTALINQCETTATEHNSAVIGDFVFTGAGGALGAAGAIASQTNTKTDLAVAATISAGVAVLASSLVAFTASNFASNDCSNVVGALPAVPIAPAPPPASAMGAAQ